MSNKLEIEIKDLENTVNVVLKGQIDEDAELEEIKNITSDSIIIDFESVSMINSCGVREWINLIESLSPNIKLTYTKCPQVVIEQINMVHGFIRKGTKVESFYAPYYSEDNDEVIKVLLNTSDIKDGKAPVKKSDTGEELEFDAIEAQYFQFITQMS